LLGSTKKVAIRCTEEFPEGKGHEWHGLLAPISILVILAIQGIALGS